jgi:hypothetical protein
MISARSKRKARREAHRALAKIVGEQQADQLIALAYAARRDYDLCLCSNSVDMRSYKSDEEAAADRSAPALTCGACGKQKLRLAVVAGKVQRDAQISVWQGERIDG